MSVLLVALMAGLVPGLGQRHGQSALAQQAQQATLSLGVAPGGNVVCRPPTLCDVALSSGFTVRLSIDALPESGYSGYQVEMGHPGLTAKAVRYVAPDLPVTFPVVGIGTETVQAGALTAIQQPPLPVTTQAGVLLEEDLTCPPQPATFTATLGRPFTEVKDQNGADLSITTIALTIRCKDPLLFDTDGDGCPDGKEQQTAMDSQLTGGRRDYHNPWDYWDAQPNGQVRITDILAVVAQYYQDKYLDPPTNSVPNPSYTDHADRTYVGPNPWNLGAPDGLVRIPDIVNELNQFYHDCS